MPNRLVKLNNPLMGTETPIPSAFITASVIRVKLNNPLMGTETLELQKKYKLYRNKGVKLNNPLMGTETP